MMIVYLGGKKCGNTQGSCINVPSEPLSTHTKITLIVVGVVTFLIILVSIWYFCYYRRRQLAARHVYLSSPVTVQTQWQPSFQSLDVLNCRGFDSRNMPPTYQQATQNRQ